MVWNPLAGQWLGLGTFTAGGPSSISGQGIKILQKPRGAGQKKKVNFMLFILPQLKKKKKKERKVKFPGYTEKRDEWGRETREGRWSTSRNPRQ